MVNAVKGRERNHDQRAKGRINEGKFNIAGEHGLAIDGAVLKEGFDALAVDHHVNGKVRDASVLNNLPGTKNEAQQS